MDKKNCSTWFGIVAAGILATALSGCGGSGDTGPAGAVGPAGPAGPPGASSGNVINVGSNAATNATVINANAAAWEALEPTVTVSSVAIASPPEVNFSVSDAFGRPVVGLGNKSKTSTAKFANYPNLAFSLAKLVPGTNGAPSKWVSYIVTTVETNSVVPAPQRPGTDNTGTLVDNGDGSYKYTFYRDIPGVKAAVAAMAASAVAASANNNVADLGDLTYDASLTHRLTIQLSGFAPGTGAAGERGINTPTGAPSSIAGVPMKKPYDAIYDFIPATGAKVTATDVSRDIVANTNCEACHRKLGGIPGLSGAEDAAAFHGGGRNNVQYCAVCHTDQRKYGQAEATATLNGTVRTFMPATGNAYKVDGRAIGNLPNLIHKVHASKLLVHKNYDYADVKLNEPTYPQDIRNCTSCHDGSTTVSRTTKTKDGNNWKSVPAALACGSCHDGINFATGTGVTLRDAAAGLTSSNINNTGIAHPAGPQPDDSNCALCHKSNGTFPLADIDLSHFPVTPPSARSALHVPIATGGNANTNSAFIASGASVGRLPPGAIKVTYDIRSVSRDANGRPVMVFRMLQNGTAVALNDFATVAPDAVTGKKEIWPNFMGAPSLYWAFAVPQDGIAAPADINATINIYLRCLWDGTAGTAACGTSTSGALSTAAGTLAAGTGADAGYYVATLTGATIPASAVMLTGGMGYSYNVRTALPLTQTNAAGYATAASTVPVAATDAAAGTSGSDLYPSMPNRTGGLIVIAPNVQKVATGYTGRRAIVEDARCNACHQELGTFTEDAFHAGQRNDGTTCSWCHTPNRTSSGWSVDSTHFVHAIHASAKRQVPFTYQATTTNPAGFAEVTYPGILNDCLTCHLPGTYDFSATASANAVGQGADQLDKRQYRTVGTGTYAAGPALSPFVQPPYASALGTAYGSGFSFNQFTGATTAAAVTTLVMSPTVTACSACHNTADSISHFKINGAAYYQPRSTGITGTNETCLICHGTGRIADIAVMHSKNR